jgi:glutamate synthase (NADPH/NADH) large chain
MVDLEPIAPTDPAGAEGPGMPQLHAFSVEDNGMGDLLRFDAERLRILVERHLLVTGSARARALLDDWQTALARFVKIMPRDYRRALGDLQREPQAAAAE